MLFISILLSVWFSLWLMYAIFVKDSLKLLVIWLKDMYEDPEEQQEEQRKVYTLRCNECGYEWMSYEKSCNYCPNCGVKNE